MPGLTPGQRLQPAFAPFKKQDFGDCALQVMEFSVTEPLFGCRMREEVKYLGGREIKHPPKFFLGAAASPFSSNPKFQALREQKKVNAGAQFFQTNVVYDIDGMEIWLNELAKRNVLGKVYILIGITPLKSLKMAQILSKVPGVCLPSTTLRRMEAADRAGNAKEEGIQIALELIHQIKQYHQGINGIHLMPVGWDEVIPRIIMEAGLLPRSPAIQALNPTK